MTASQESKNAAAIASMVAGATVERTIRGKTIILTAPTREAADEVLRCLTDRADAFLQLEAKRGDKTAAELAIENPELTAATRELNFLAVAACLPDVDRVEVGRWLGLLEADEKKRITDPALDLCGVTADPAPGEQGEAESGDFPSSSPERSGDQ